MGREKVAMQPARDHRWDKEKDSSTFQPEGLLISETASVEISPGPVLRQSSLKKVEDR